MIFLPPSLEYVIISTLNIMYYEFLEKKIKGKKGKIFEKKKKRKKKSQVKHLEADHIGSHFIMHTPWQQIICF